MKKKTVFSSIRAWFQFKWSCLRFIFNFYSFIFIESKWNGYLELIVLSDQIPLSIPFMLMFIAIVRLKSIYSFYSQLPSHRMVFWNYYVKKWKTTHRNHSTLYIVYCVCNATDQNVIAICLWIFCIFVSVKLITLDA